MVMLVAVMVMVTLITMVVLMAARNPQLWKAGGDGDDDGDEDDDDGDQQCVSTLHVDTWAT